MFVSLDQVFLCIVSIISLHQEHTHSTHQDNGLMPSVTVTSYYNSRSSLSHLFGSLSYTYKKGEYLLQSHYVVLPSFDFVCDSLKPLCNLLGHVMHAPTKLKGRCQGVEWLYCSNKVRLTSSSMIELSACTS